MVTPCFVNTDGGNYPINNLVVEGASDNDAVTVQVVNPDGTWGAKGVWLNEYDGFPAGWFTDSSGLVDSTISLTPGQAVFFYSTASSAKIQSTGAVSGAFTYSVPTGYSMIGNTTTSPIAIDSITIEGASDNDAVTVQVVNPDGTWGAKGVWLNEYDGFPAGWFTDSSGEKSADITLKPGQSVFLYTTAKGAKVLMPSAL